MPTKLTLTMPRATLPDKRVRFAPFVEYLGEETPPPELEESFNLDGSVIGRRSSGCNVANNSKRGSGDLHDMFGMEKPIGLVGDGSSGGFSFGGSFLDHSDNGMGAFLGSFRADEEEDLTEMSGHDAQGSHKKSGFRAFEKTSDSSFPDLGPLNLEEEEGMKGSSSEGNTAFGRAAMTT